MTEEEKKPITFREYAAFCILTGQPLPRKGLPVEKVQEITGIVRNFERHRCANLVVKLAASFGADSKAEGDDNDRLAQALNTVAKEMRKEPLQALTINLKTLELETPDKTDGEDTQAQTAPTRRTKSLSQEFEEAKAQGTQHQNTNR